MGGHPAGAPAGAWQLWQGELAHAIGCCPVMAYSEPSSQVFGASGAAVSPHSVHPLHWKPDLPPPTFVRNCPLVAGVLGQLGGDALRGQGAADHRCAGCRV